MMHFMREVEKLKRDLYALYDRVEAAFRLAVDAVEQRNPQLSQQVFDEDDQIDEMEVDLEESCLKILALYQPVSNDLRFIIAALKMNNDLERIGDLSVNLGKRAVALSKFPPTQLELNFRAMADQAYVMLRNSMKALIEQDVQLAKEVMASDKIVDAMNKEINKKVRQAIREHPEQTDALIPLISVSRQIERVADHATNICEDIIYIIEGRIVRHRADDLAAGDAQSQPQG